MEKREKKKGKEQDPTSLGRWDHDQENDESVCSNTQTAEDQAVGGIDLVHRFTELHSLLNFSTCICCPVWLYFYQWEYFWKIQNGVVACNMADTSYFLFFFSFCFFFFKENLGHQMIHNHEDVSSWISNLQTKSLKSSGKETLQRNHRQAMLLKKRHSRMEPKKMGKEKRPFWNKYMEQSFWLSLQMSLIPRCRLFSSICQWRLHLAKLLQYLGRSCSDLQDKRTWTFSCESWTNYCILSKSHQSHCFAQKNSRGILFCIFKSCKSSQISWNKGGFISFSNKGNTASALSSQHEQVADLPFLFCQKIRWQE